MHTVALNVAQRECFNELANKDENLDRIRMMFDQTKWLSNECEIFWVTTEMKDVLLNVWETITPK